MMLVHVFPILVFLAASTFAQLIPRQTVAPFPYANGTSAGGPTGATITGTSSPRSTGGLIANVNAQSYCCFVLQDTVTPVFWASYYTSTWYGMRKVTSVVTHVTEYVDTTITNYETTTTVKNTTYYSTSQVAYDGIPEQNMNSNGPFTSSSMLNGTATEFFGQAIASPTGFYVYPTVKVIKAPAVTQANGQLACRASSAWSLLCPGSSSHSTVRDAATFTDINTYAAGYYSGQLGPSTSIWTYGNSSSIYTTTRNQTNPTAFPTMTEISFSTPFVFFPAKGKTEAIETDDFPIVFAYSTTPTGSSTITSTSTIELTSTVYVTASTTTSTPTTTRYTSTSTINTVNHDYGYVPQKLIDWMAADPNYAAQYPGLESCLPGGPTIVPFEGCAYAAAGVATEVPDLITGTAVTVKGKGCFHPGNCPAATESAALLGAAVGAGGDVTPTAVPAVAQTESPEKTMNPMSVLAPFAVGAGPSASLTSGTGQSEQVNEGAQQTQSSISNSPSSQSTSSPGGLGAIIAGAFGSHASTTAEEIGSVGSAQEQTSTASVAQEETPVVGSTAEETSVGSFTLKETPANSPSPIVIGSQTLIAGSSAIVVSGSTFSLAPSASAIIINDLSSALDQPVVTANPAPVLTIGSQPITLNSASEYIIQSQTLAAGSSPIVISGSTYSLAPSASALIINGKTSPLAPSSVPPASAPVITIAGQAVTENSASQFIVGSQTLAPGNTPIVVSGTTYSLAPSASAIVVNGDTAALPAYTPVSPTTAPVITIGTRPYTASLVSGSDYVIGTQTLVPGASAITASGVEVSLAPSASDIVVGGTTKAFEAATGVANATSFSPETFTADAPRIGIGLKGIMLGIGLGLLGLVAL